MRRHHSLGLVRGLSSEGSTRTLARIVLGYLYFSHLSVIGEALMSSI